MQLLKTSLNKFSVFIVATFEQLFISRQIYHYTEPHKQNKLESWWCKLTYEKNFYDRLLLKIFYLL